MINTPRIKIAIASGKGGTGKTLTATNLFYLLQNESLPVTLVDCDAEEPNTMVFFNTQASQIKNVSQKNPVIDLDKCTFCGRCHEYCSYNAIFFLPEQKTIQVIDDLCHGCGACSVACNDGAITEREVILGTVSKYPVTNKSQIIEARMEIGIYSPVSIIKEAIKEAGNNNIVLMDAPPGTSCPFIQTVSRADYVVLVTEPTPFGLSDLKQSVDTLKTLDKACGVIINRAGLGDNEVYTYLKEANIPLLMEIPFDKGIAADYSNGKLVLDSRPELAQKFKNMFQSIINNNGNSSN
ncbi:MAG: P-loop NTPase [Salinivirgaceae bacterium]